MPKLVACCILLNFYIKPQLDNTTAYRGSSCILLNFYIKPQQFQSFVDVADSCILLNFYIKPQQNEYNDPSAVVVSYWISTSNHNLTMRIISRILVVSYWISTSNHNTQQRR